MEESGYITIAQRRPPIRTGRKWRVEEATDEAISQAKWKEILGVVQTGRNGIDLKPKKR